MSLLLFPSHIITAGSVAGDVGKAQGFGPGAAALFLASLAAAPLT